MPDIQLSSELTLHYEDDDFADPWEPHETVVLLHGFAESSAAWFAWVPTLARRLRVVRPDLRGFGGSSVPPHAATYGWSTAGFAGDVVSLLDRLEIERAHLVGARVGGPVAIQLAADHPGRVRSLSLVSGLVRGQDVRGLRTQREVVSLPDFARRIRERGLAAWFEETGAARLGPSTAPGQIAHWARLMAQSDEEVCVGMMRTAAVLDVSALLARVVAPTLVIASAESAVQTVAATRDWQRQIARSELIVLPGDSPHLAATAPDECARRVLEFIAHLDGGPAMPSQASGS